MRIARHVSELIGNTPLVQLNSVVPDGAGTVAAKIEYLNPGGSAKDRIAVKMIDAAEASGELQARRHHRRTDVRQHRRRAGAGRPAARLQMHLRLPGQGQRGQAERVARVRRRRRGVPDGRAARPSRQLLQRLQPTGRGDRRRVEARPVLQPDGARPATTRPPGPRSGPTPTARSPISSRASAPAAPSPAPAATSRRCPAGRCASSASTRRGRCTPAAPGGRTWSRASARTSGRRPTTRRCPTRSSRCPTPTRSR